VNRKKYLDFAIFAGLTGFVAWAFNLRELHLALRFLTFQTRDLMRANELYNGQWIFFGPEMTGGGHLPGPFYYYLLAATWPVRNLISPLDLLLGMMVAAAMAGFLYIRRRLSLESGLLFLMLFVLSTTVENLMNQYMNVSFAVPLLVFAFICILEAFRPTPESRRKKAFWCACLLLGLALQLHASSLAFVLALAILQGLSPRYGLQRLSARTILIGAGIFLIPCLPYLVWSAAESSGHPFGQPTFFAGAAHAALPSLFYYFDFPGIQRFFRLAFCFMVELPLVFWPLIGAFFFNRIRGPQIVEKSPDYFFPATVCLVAGIVPAAFQLFTPIAVRYVGPLVVASIFVAIFLHARLNNLREHFTFVFLGSLTVILALLYFAVDPQPQEIEWFFASRHYLAGIATLLMIFASLIWQRKLWANVLGFAIVVLLALVQNPSAWGNKMKMKLVFIPSNNEWTKIGETICNDYGWSFSEIQRRFYFVDMHMELDANQANNFKQKCTNPRPASEMAPDGFIVTSRFNLKTGTAKEFLLAQPLADEIKAGLENDDLKLGEARNFHSLVMVPYFVRTPKNCRPTSITWARVTSKRRLIDFCAQAASLIR
jgi:hypothetical protein